MSESIGAAVARQKAKARADAEARAKMTPEEKKKANEAAVKGMKTELPAEEEGTEYFYDAQGRATSRRTSKGRPRAKAATQGDALETK